MAHSRNLQIKHRNGWKTIILAEICKYSYSLNSFTLYYMSKQLIYRLKALSLVLEEYTPISFEYEGWKLTKRGSLQNQFMEDLGRIYSLRKYFPSFDD